MYLTVAGSSPFSVIQLFVAVNCQCIHHSITYFILAVTALLNVSRSLSNISLRLDVEGRVAESKGQGLGVVLNNEKPSHIVCSVESGWSVH